MPLHPPYARRPWLALLMLCPSLALADTPAELPDVEVTASVVEQPLPTTTRTDAETLERRQIRSFDDLSRRAEPGVNYNRSNNSINWIIPNKQLKSWCNLYIFNYKRWLYKFVCNSISIIR